MTNHNLVLYTQDFEPITIVSIPFYLIERMEKWGGPIKMLVPFSWDEIYSMDERDAMEVQIRTIDIWPERMRWKDGTNKLILVTNYEIDALKMPLEFLPGQRTAFNQMLIDAIR